MSMRQIIKILSLALTFLFIIWNLHLLIAILSGLLTLLCSIKVLLLLLSLHLCCWEFFQETFQNWKFFLLFLDLKEVWIIRLTVNPIHYLHKLSSIEKIEIFKKNLFQIIMLPYRHHAFCNHPNECWVSVALDLYFLGSFMQSLVHKLWSVFYI